MPWVLILLELPCMHYIQLLYTHTHTLYIYWVSTEKALHRNVAWSNSNKGLYAYAEQTGLKWKNDKF